MLSPPVTSPCVPSSNNGCVAEPPMPRRSVVTVRPVLAGFVPGVTVTFSNVELPAVREFGVADPVPLGLPHEWIDDELRGFAAPDVKSAPLLSESVQPPLARESAVVFVSDGAGAVSKQLGALLPVPYPTKSTMLAPVGHAPDRAVAVLTSATLAFVALMAMLPVASGVGKLVVPAVPAASCTR